METQTLQYTHDHWSTDSFPNLDSKNTLVLIFASPKFRNNPKPIEELAQKYPNAQIIGCSGSGEISGASILDDSLSVALTKFESTQIKSIRIDINKFKNSYEAGTKVAETLKGSKLRGIFVLSDGLKVNGSELVKGLNDATEKGVVITGGLAGDGADFKQTWSIHQGRIYENSIVAVGFYGDSIKINHASKGGWDIFGPERRITHSESNVLYEVDGQPILPLYKQYLGNRAEGLPATGLLFPLAIRKDKNDKNPLVRTMLGADDKKQSLTFAGDVPSGYLVQMMRANIDRLISSAGEAGEKLVAKKVSVEKPILCLTISCVGRRLLMGERTEEEIESVARTLPKGSQIVGFYSYGELSPFTAGECYLHNQTMTLTSFEED